MSDLTIDQFMTRGPHTIGHHQSLAAAGRMMGEHAIRHLPVLEAGKLMGVVTDRDLAFVESLKGLDPEEVKVSDAMSADVFVVGPRASVRETAIEMAEHKYGSAVVMENGHVVGVFTTVDALKALGQILAATEQPSAAPRNGAAANRSRKN
jgi:acetoin utilization protein AcuB